MAGHFDSSIVYDCIVVGGGIIGFGAAFQMAKQGYKTLLLEQFSLPHFREARLANPASFVMPTLRTTIRRWFKRYNKCGKSLNKKQTQLYVGEYNLYGMLNFEILVQLRLPRSFHIVYFILSMRTIFKNQ